VSAIGASAPDLPSKAFPQRSLSTRLAHFATVKLGYELMDGREIELILSELLKQQLLQ
jgi:hypothetical protein